MEEEIQYLRRAGALCLSLRRSTRHVSLPRWSPDDQAPRREQGGGCPVGKERSRTGRGDREVTEKEAELEEW